MDAFILPYLGRSLGVVFWQTRRAPARPRAVSSEATPARRAGHISSTNQASAAESFDIYAPAEVTAGEAARLQAAYHASLGAALAAGDRIAGVAGLLTLWWLLGIAAAVLLGLRALEFGPGYSWISLIAVLLTLPVARRGGGRPFTGNRYAFARRLARRATVLPPARGTQARYQEQCAALWQASRRQHGTEAQQLQALEDLCHEQAWPAAAAVYRDFRHRLAPRATSKPSVWRWPPARGRGGVPHYTAVEMRAW